MENGYHIHYTLHLNAKKKTRVEKLQSLRIPTEHQAAGPGAGPRRQPPLDSGTVAPLGIGMALHHGPGRRMVDPPGNRVAAASLPGAHHRRDIAASSAPLCDGADPR